MDIWEHGFKALRGALHLVFGHEALFQSWALLCTCMCIRTVAYDACSMTMMNVVILLAREAELL